ncbi:hypothetical protein [Jiangella alkaliphila]|uniref:hypothetical protein n=1 Tax=Jiangella alkaliphila TaxID=419479 RepID=UPI0012F85533|nr:hypothetical protein [Jiangella alkaliphila]
MRLVARVAATLALTTAVAVWTAAGPAAADEADVDRYLDEVAVELSQPGVWIDPDASDAFGRDEAADLDEAAAAAPVDMRIAVVPAWKLDPEGQDRLVGRFLLYEGEELASQLYDRVGVDGVYLVMSVADSSYDGRGLWGVQHSEDGPAYYVEDAIDQAVDCCAPEYGPMIDRFIDRASEVDHPFYIDVAPWAGGAVGVAGLWWGGTTLSARRRRRADEQGHLDVVRPMLTEEVIELSDRVSDLPTTSDIAQAALTKEILDTVEKARHPAGQGGLRRRRPGGDVAARHSALQDRLPRGAAAGKAGPRADAAVLLRPAARAEHAAAAVDAGRGRRTRGAGLRPVRRPARRRRGAAGPRDGTGPLLGGRRGPRRLHRGLLERHGRHLALPARRPLARPRLAVEPVGVAAAAGQAREHAPVDEPCGQRGDGVLRRRLLGLQRRLGRLRRVQRTEPAAQLRRWVEPAIDAPVRRRPPLLTARPGARLTAGPEVDLGVLRPSNGHFGRELPKNSKINFAARGQSKASSASRAGSASGSASASASTHRFAH